MSNLVLNGSFNLRSVAPGTAVSGGTVNNWTPTGAYGLINFGTGATYSNTGLPSNITYCVYLQQNASVSQNITFSTAGNYLLSFWAYNTLSASTDIILQTDLGTNGVVASNTITNVGLIWIQYSISFSVSSSQTQPLSFKNISSTVSQFRVSGVSIVYVPDPVVPPVVPVVSSTVSLVKNGNFSNPAITTTKYFDFQNMDWFKVSGLYSTCGIGNRTAGPYVSTIPAEIDQYLFMYDATQIDRVAQPINFNMNGNYVITFWTACSSTIAEDLYVKIGNSSGLIANDSLSTFDGEILNSTIELYQSYGWRKYTIPFTVKTPSFSKSLSFGGRLDNNGSFLYVSNVSIYATDYTLDLYFEWIPDDDVKKITGD